MRSLKEISRRTWFRALAIALIAFLTITLLVVGYVYYQAVKTFEVRRFSLPTRIFTDMVPLQAGVPLPAEHLREKLERLGFRETPQISEPGQYTVSGNDVDLYLRAFRHPSGEHAAQRVKLTLGRGVIENVTSPEGSTANAALEPELLTSILSDQLENRSPVRIDQVPQHMQDAIVVTEDVRFWKHPGVDPIGVFRALFRNVKAGGVAEGGSTLTQQLVKNYYLTNERTFRRKAVEAFMSVILDAKYSKREILEAYVNDIYLGRNRSISILGMGEASRFYFGKPISEINIAQAATLAGMIRSPNNLSPFANPEKAMTRRTTVLGSLLKEKKITQAQYDAAMKEPLPKKPYRQRSGLGSIPFYVDRVNQELVRDYGIEDVKGRGLNIYTAIDLDWQDEATRQLEAGLAGLEKSNRRLRRDDPMQGVMIGVDVASGEIRALVGGRNFERSQFNRALLAKRQVGSLFKPFVFLAAFEPSLSRQNITPATLVNDTRFVLKRRFSDDWSPRNYEGSYQGVVTVRRALEHSLNAASVRLGLSVGTDAIIKTAHALGVDTEIEDNPSMILGAVGVPPIEMAEAYTTIARIGSRMPLHTVRYVTTEDGKVIAGADQHKAVQVFPARDAFLIAHVMEGVVDRGSGARARSHGFTKRAAGKTGTTNDKRDAWFIGFTPKTLALTWIGFDDNTPIGVSGSEGAVPIWAKFMKKVTAADQNVTFAPPPNIVFAQVDEKSGGLATATCPANLVVNEAFKAGTEPRGQCLLHSVQVPVVDPGLMQTTTDYSTDPTLTGGFDTSTLGTLPPEPIDPAVQPYQQPEPQQPEPQQPEPPPAPTATIAPPPPSTVQMTPVTTTSPP